MATTTPKLDPRLTFDAFVVGAANRLACAAARRVAEAPGEAYNPLFIYSASGLGKTHLVSGIGHAARDARSELRVTYNTLARLMDEVAAAIEAGERDAFRSRLTDADLLLVDDVQFLAGRRQTQEELLGAWDALMARGGQVVLASDRPPQEIDGLDDRLLSRFSGGLIVDIEPPDYETRVAILRRKVDAHGERLEPGVAEAVARMGFRNVRELQGALNRILAAQEMEDRRVAPEEVPVLLAKVAEPTTGEFDSFLVEVAGTLAEVVAGPLPAPPTGHRLETVGLPEDAFARRAATAVVRQPGERYNPLYLHGPADSPTAALLAAIGNELLAARPGLAVAYLDARAFAGELIDALEHDRVPAWRARYRTARVLLIDDVDALAETERAQDELFHLFDELQRAGAQLVFAASRAPHELDGVEERLRTRLAGGLVVELDRPDVPAADAPVAVDGAAEAAAEDAEAATEATGTANATVAADTARPAEAIDSDVAGEPAAGPAGDRWFRDREKIVWRWPYPEELLLERAE